MKVLFRTYNTCFQNEAGGMQSRVHKIKSLLEKEGITVDFFDEEKTKLVEYDVIHLFRLDCENYSLVRCAKTKGLKIIISSVVPLTGGRKLKFLKHISRLPLLTTYKMMKYQLDVADIVVAETNREAYFIKKYYSINKDKIKVIPNGLDEKISYTGNDIFDYIGGEKDFVLCVGRFDKNKNQKTLIKAMANSSIPIVFIGGPARDSESYYEECLKLAEELDNVFFLGWQEKDSRLLQSAYVNCKVFVLPSYKETFGLVILEAISAGANVVVSDTLPILDYNFIDKLHSFNPSNEKDIYEKVSRAYKEDKPNGMYDKIKNIFSWDEIIGKYINLYK